MAKLTKEIREEIKEYCLNSITSDDVEFKHDLSDDDNENKLKYVYNRFRSEYGHEIKRVSEFKAFSEWLQGLALDIAFMNNEILELAKRWGQDVSTESKQDKILSQYWDFMTNQYFKLFRKYKIEVV